MNIVIIPFIQLALAFLVGPQQDTVVVKADGPPVWGTRPTLVEEIRIGVLDGDEVYTLGYVSGVAVALDGIIWVADAQAYTIRRYDSNGNHVGSIGRRGEGPGEFGSISSLQRLPDGRFAVWDSRLARVTIFDSDGSLHRTVRIPTVGMASGEHETLRVDNEGRLYVFHLTPVGRGTARFFWIRIDQTGQVIDTLSFPPSRVEGPRFGGRSYPFGLMAPFSVKTMSAPSPGGYLVTGRNDAYALHRPLSDGRILRIVRSWTPVKVQPDERNERESLGEHFRARNPDSRETSTAVPSVKPPFWALWVDQESRIWVARHAPGIRVPESPGDRARRERAQNPPSEWWDQLVFDVIGADGRYFGTVEFANPRSNPMVAHGRQIWTIDVGEFGEHYVVRYRITPS